MGRKLTREERANLAHALDHLHANRDEWYIGNKKQFIERHRRAIEMLQEWLRADEEERRAKEGR